MTINTIYYNKIYVNVIALSQNTLIFSDCGWPWVTETMESKSVEDRGLL